MKSWTRETDIEFQHRAKGTAPQKTPHTSTGRLSSSIYDFNTTSRYQFHVLYSSHPLIYIQEKHKVSFSLNIFWFLHV